MFLDNLDNIYLYITLVLFLVIASYFDIKYLKIPNKLNLSFFVIRFALIPIIGFSMDNIYGFLFAFLIFLIPAMIANKPMGGDIKAFSVIGLYLGFKTTILSLIIIIVISIIYMTIKKFIYKDINDIPLAPFFLLSILILIVLQTTTSIATLI